jgi:hypothetical protein
MSETKHTPGPWKCEHSGYANAPFVVFTGEVPPKWNRRYPLSGVNWIAEVKCDESEHHEEHRANAHLIEAAPALLESLESLLAYLRAFWPMEPLFSTHDDRQAMEIADAEVAIRKAKGIEGKF